MLYKKYPMTNCRQSEILFLDVKMKNTNNSSVFYLIKMKDIASKNSPSNRPRHVLIYTPLIHWRPGGTKLYVLNSITTIAIVSRLSNSTSNYRNTIAIVKISSIVTTSRQKLRWLSRLSDVLPPLRSRVRALYRTSDRT